MTKIKLCGLTRAEDIYAVNELLPEYIGFIFTQKSKRYVSYERAESLRKILDKRINAVGVFVNESIDAIMDLVNRKVIDIVQLHGDESEEYIGNLRQITNCPIIKAHQIKTATDTRKANKSTADFVLLDSSGGSGEAFDHSLLKGINRPYFLAGGITPENAASAIRQYKPFAVDVSSALETDGFKDKNKMTAFVNAVRKADKYE